MVSDQPASHVIPGRPVIHVPIRWLGVILIGGAAGTAVRAWLERVFAPAAGHWPWTTFWINVSGALVLGVLLEILAESGPDRGWRRGFRLGVGTGVMGGFTTYSTFAVETVKLMQAGRWLLGGGYALASILAGLALAFSGARVVRRSVRLYRRGRPVAQ